MYKPLLAAASLLIGRWKQQLAIGVQFLASGFGWPYVVGNPGAITVAKTFDVPQQTPFSSMGDGACNGRREVGQALLVCLDVSMLHGCCIRKISNKTWVRVWI